MVFILRFPVSSIFFSLRLPEASTTLSKGPFAVHCLPDAFETSFSKKKKKRNFLFSRNDLSGTELHWFFSWLSAFFFFPSPFLSGSSSFPHLKMLESLRVLVYRFFYFPNSLPRTCHPANKIYRHIFPIFPFLLSPASLVNHGILYQFVFLESPLRCQLVHCTC